MAHLHDFVQKVIAEGLAKKTAQESEIVGLIKNIADSEKKIVEDYSKIGELYVKTHGDDNEGELGAMVQDVKASEKSIKDSKLKIGELMGKNFCPVCCEEVDEDALYCNNCGAKMPVKLMPGMVLCPHCQKAVRKGIRFCTNCGGSMVEEPKPEVNVKTCPNCGWETEDMDKMFCDACGRRLTGTEEEEEKQEVEKVPTKKVCPNCGWSIFDAETMFCDACGRRLEEAE